MSALNIQVKPGTTPDITVLALDGPLLIANVPGFRRWAQTATTPIVVLDFAHSSYMDSAGLGAVLQLHKQLAAQQRRLVLVGLNQRIAALMQLTRVDTLLDIRVEAADVS